MIPSSAFATAQPIFVVGSPRSGTSILTWCLGQHPNLLGLEESNWMAPFAVDLAVAFSRGSARGEQSQFSSMGMNRDQFMQELGDSIIASIIDGRDNFETRRSQLAMSGRPTNHPAFRISRNRSDPKSRWVNGTPEYSLEICGLRKLFPDAKFIHLVRDCDRVADSMLNFDRVSGTKFAQTKSEGFQKWMKYVHACLAAEEAYGPMVVCRLLHQDLVQEPDKAIRRVLKFLGEPFAAECLEPLAKRINSSNLGTEGCEDLPLVESPESLRARALWRSIQETPPPSSASPETLTLLEEEFEERVEYSEGLGAELLRTQIAHAELSKEFENRTAWALQLRKELTEASEPILRLQAEYADRTKWALDLSDELARKNELVLKLQAETERQNALIRDLQTRLRKERAPGANQ